MVNYFNLGRAYYTYLKKRTMKIQCIVSVICDDVDVKHSIMDGLLFDGAFIYDGQQEGVDGAITVRDGNITVNGCEVSDLEYGDYVSNPNGAIIKK